MALTQVILNNSDAVLSNGMVLDSGKIKFCPPFCIGNVDGTKSTADSLLNGGYGYHMANDGSIWIDDGEICKYNSLGLFQSKFSRGAGAGNPSAGRGTAFNETLGYVATLYYNPSGTLYIQDFDGNILHNFSGWSYPRGLCITDSSKIALFDNADSKFKIYQYDNDAGTLTLLHEVVQSYCENGYDLQAINNRIYVLYARDIVRVYDEDLNLLFECDFDYTGNNPYNTGFQVWNYAVNGFFVKNGEIWVDVPDYGKWLIFSDTDGSQVRELMKKETDALTSEQVRISHRINGQKNYIDYNSETGKLSWASQVVNYGKVSIFDTRYTQQVLYDPYTATADGDLVGFNISGEQLNLCTWEYRINSGSWVAYTDDSYSPLSVSISTGDTIELRAYGGDFEEAEKGGLSISDPYIQINYETETPDTPVITSPIDGATVTIYDDEVTEIEVTCENTAQILKVYDDGVDTEVNEYHASGTTHTIPGVPCTAGEHIFTVKAMSTDGTKTSSASNSVTIQAAKGELSTVSMPLEAIITNNRVTLTIT